MPTTRSTDYTKLGPIMKFLSPENQRKAAACHELDLQFARLEEARERKRIALAEVAAAQEKRRRLGCTVTAEIEEAEKEANEAEKDAKKISTQVRDEAEKEAKKISTQESDDEEDREQARALKLAHRRQLEQSTLYEQRVLSTIKEVKDVEKYTFDDLHGCPDPKKDAYNIVFNVNNGAPVKDIAKGLMFVGPPGTGKDVLVKILVHEIKGVTFFDIPTGFGTHAPDIWPVLITTAYERAPAIVYFNECDGVFSGNKKAASVKSAWDVTSAWDAGIDTGKYVLMVSSSNYVQKIDPALVTRFGKPYHFQKLTDDQRLVLFKRKLLESIDDMEVKNALDGASDDEWRALGALIPQDTSARYITVDLIPKVKSQVFREQHEDNRTTPLSLDDFKKYLQADSKKEEDSKQSVVDWIRLTFEPNSSEQREVRYKEKELVITLFEDILPAMPDDILRKLGPLDLGRLRTQKNVMYLEQEFLKNFKSCFVEAVYECEFMNLSSKPRQQLSRSETRHGNGDVTYKETFPGIVRRGWVVRNIRWRCLTVRAPDPERDSERMEWARGLGGITAEVDRLLAEYPTWNQKAVDEIMENGAFPYLVSIDGDSCDGGFSCTCTLKHPSGATVTDIKVPRSTLRIFYKADV